MTHVVTSRPIPPENDTSPTELNPASGGQSTADGPHTVNPSLLERNVDGHIVSLKGDGRREQSNMDVLHRSRKMGMKIWALDKLQRMIATINDGEISGHGLSTRGNHGGGNTRKGENDLSQVLRNELVNGPSDRDPFSSIKEMIMFKGPFIYIHDMDEKTKPVMVREYPKVARRQDGAWPQFRSAPLGKCPFVEEPPTRKTARQRSRQQEKEKKPAGKPTTEHDTRKQEAEPQRAVEKQGVRETGGEVKEEGGLEEPEARRAQAQPTTQKVPTKEESPKKSSESFVPPQMPRTGPFYLGHEPAASGVQPSNITSAIRSQMISSTATAPGAKAGLSKEVHELKRKVLEKSNGSVPIAAPPQRSANPPGLKMKEPGHPGKMNLKGKCGPANEEDTTQSEGHGGTKRPFGSRKSSQPKEERRRDPKPGYCENCREKFDDFDEVSAVGLERETGSNSHSAHANKEASQVRHVVEQLGRVGRVAGAARATAQGL